jgi:hypothetical protein
MRKMTERPGLTGRIKVSIFVMLILRWLFDIQGKMAKWLALVCAALE